MMPAVRTIQYSLCLVSMVLTGLFALSLAGLEIGSESKNQFSIGAILGSALFIIIGCCIDLGKYIFWVNKSISRYYAYISIVLTLFSLAASCAFFISMEETTLSKLKTESQEFLNLQSRGDAIKTEIRLLETLVNNRLSSRYHDQWEEAEENTQKIRDLNDELFRLNQNTTIGTFYAENKLPVTRFFNVIGQSINISPDIVRSVFYVALAMLLEVSALAAISLNRELKNRLNESEGISDIPKEFPNNDVKNRIQALIKDIKNGSIPPVIRKIRASNYGLGISDIKKALNSMVQEGVLEPAGRKSLKLTEDGKREKEKISKD